MRGNSHLYISKDVIPLPNKPVEKVIWRLIAKGSFYAPDVNLFIPTSLFTKCFLKAKDLFSLGNFNQIRSV